MFSLIPLLDRLLVDNARTTAVTCLALNDNVIYLGMSSGRVLLYHYNNTDSTFVLIQNQPAPKPHANISHISVLHHSQALALLADSILVFYDLALHPYAARQYKHISAIATDLHAHTQSASADYLLIAKRKSILKLKVVKPGPGSVLTVSEINEFHTPDGVMSMVWHSNHVYIANPLYAYQCLTIHPLVVLVNLAHLDPSLPVSALQTKIRPHLALISHDQVLITCQTSDPVTHARSALGIVLNPVGEPVSDLPTIHWSAYPQSIAFHYPYILALVPDTSDTTAPFYFTAHNLLNQTTSAPDQIEPIPIHPLGLLHLPAPIQSQGANGQFKVLARERNALYALACPSYPHIVNDWLRTARKTSHGFNLETYAPILKLAHVTIPETGKLRVYAAVAMIAVQFLDLDQALPLCIDASVHPHWLISLYNPNLPPSVLDYETVRAQLATVGMKSGSFNEISNKAAQKLNHASSATESAIDRFLLSYLDHWHVKSSKPDFLVEYIRLELMLKLQLAGDSIVEQTQTVSGLVSKEGSSVPLELLQSLSNQLRSHDPYAASLIDLQLGSTTNVLAEWIKLIDSGTGLVTFARIADVLVSDGSDANIETLQWLIQHDRDHGLRVLRAWEPEFDPFVLSKYGQENVLMYFSSIDPSPGQRTRVAAWLIEQEGVVGRRSHSWMREYIGSTPEISFITFLRGNLPDSLLRLTLADLVWCTRDASVRSEIYRVIVDGNAEQSREFQFELAVLQEDREQAVRQLVRDFCDFESANAVCESDHVSFCVVVDEYLKLPNRDDSSTCFMAVAVKNLNVLDFDQLIHVLPSTWPLSNASTILSHELMKMTRQSRWTTMVKSLERQQNINTKLANLKLVVADVVCDRPPTIPKGSVVLPTTCARCEQDIENVVEGVVLRAGKQQPWDSLDKKEYYHVTCFNHLSSLESPSSHMQAMNK